MLTRIGVEAAQGRSIMHMRVTVLVIASLIGIGPALAQSGFNLEIGSQSIWNIDPQVTATVTPGSSVEYDPTQVYPYTLTINTPFLSQVMNGPNVDGRILLGAQSQSLDYSAFGLWEQGGYSASGPFVGVAGAYGAGIPTNPTHLPKSQVSYVGTILFDGLWDATGGCQCYHCLGTVSATVDFGRSTIAWSTSFGSGWGTLTGTGTLSGNIFRSSFSGTLAMAAEGRTNVAVSGSLSGLIYGPKATEIAGSYEAFGTSSPPNSTTIFTGVQGAFGAHVPGASDQPFSANPVR
jgi:hypothetical protein